jgi:hypothetical protein
MPSLRPARPLAAYSSAVLAGALLLAPSGAAAAQEVELRYRFTEGLELRYEMVQRTTMGLPGGMGSMDQNQRQRYVLSVHEVHPDGSAVIRNTIEAVSLEVSSMMGSQSWDSEVDGTPADPELRPLAALVGAGVEMTVAPDGSVVDFGNMAEFMEALLGDADPELRAMLGATFGEEQLRELASQGLQQLPDGPVSAGHSWEQSLSMPMAFGEVRSTTVYTFEGVETVDGRPVARIGVSGTIGELVPEEGNPMAAMVQLSGGEMTGSARFDVERGVLVGQDMTTTMTLSVMGESMTSTSRVEVRILD